MKKKAFVLMLTLVAMVAILLSCRGSHIGNDIRQAGESIGKMVMQSTQP